MRFGWLAKAAVVAIAPVLSVVAAAQSGGVRAPALNIPENVQFVGRQEPGVRKATAIVNGDVITGSDIDQRMALIITSQQIQLPPEEIERFRAQVLRNLIDETIQVQAAAQNELTVEQREIDAQYARVAGGVRKTPEQFSAYLRTIGSSERSLKRQILGEMAWDRLQRRLIEPFVNVGDDEVQAQIADMNARRGSAEYRVAEIFLSSTPETEGEVHANVERIATQIRAGASFQAYARQYSEATTAALGGDLGWVRPEQLPPELAALVVQMPVGSISSAVPVQGGFSILALADTRQILTADARDALLSLMQLTVSLPATSTPAQVEARGIQLGQAAAAMGGCGGAAATAQAQGAELISNDQVRVRELPPLLQQMLLNLAVGQTTAPFGASDRISVLVLCGRDDPQAATAPNAGEIAGAMERERIARRARRYLRDLRRDAVIDYR